MQDTPHITPSQIMGVLAINFGYDHANKQTVKNYMMEWRTRNAFQARPLRPHRRMFRWSVERTDERERLALNHGWRLTANRNRMLVFKYLYGTVHWHRASLGGNVIVHIRGQATLAMAQETFSRAFETVLPWDEVRRLVEAPVREVGRHLVFDLGQPLPRFEIRHFEKSHGLRIYSDGSHPTAIEVAETEPFWISRLDDMAGSFKATSESFQASMQEHVDVIRQFRDESDKRSREVTKLLSTLRRSLSRTRRPTKRLKQKRTSWFRGLIKKRRGEQEQW